MDKNNNNIPDWLELRFKEDSYMPSAEDISKIEPQSVTGVFLKYFSDILVKKDQVKNVFEKQLEEFGIKDEQELINDVFKRNSGTFKAFCLKAVTDGFESEGIIKTLASIRQRIHRKDFIPMVSTVEVAVTGDPTISEGGLLHTVTVNSNSVDIKLKKYGRLLSISYETILKQNITYLYKLLYRVGVDIRDEAVSEVVKLFSSYTPIEYGDTFSYADLIDLAYRFVYPNMVNCLIAKDSTIKEILNFSEMKVPIKFNDEASYGTPHSWKFIRSGKVDYDTIICFDSKYAFLMVYDDFVIDLDCLVDRQLQKIGISTYFGFSRLFTGASKVALVNQE